VVEFSTGGSNPWKCSLGKKFPRGDFPIGIFRGDNFLWREENSPVGISLEGVSCREFFLQGVFSGWVFFWERGIF